MHVFDHQRYQEIFRRGFGSRKIARMTLVDQLILELTRALTTGVALWGVPAPRCGNCSCRCPSCPEHNCTPSLVCPRGDAGVQAQGCPRSECHCEGCGRPFVAGVLVGFVLALGVVFVLSRHSQGVSSKAAPLPLADEVARVCPSSAPVLTPRGVQVLAKAQAAAIKQAHGIGTL